jgi:ribosomal protein L9
VIVTDNIPGIGFKGEIKSVRPGFARNQLFPKKMAVYDTPGATLGCVRALF